MVLLKGHTMLRMLATILVAALPLAALAESPRTAILEVKNMSCKMCPITVRAALEKVPGVSRATIDYDSKTATVSFDPARTHVAALIKATTDAGYPSAERK